MLLTYSEGSGDASQLLGRFKEVWLGNAGSVYLNLGLWARSQSTIAAATGAFGIAVKTMLRWRVCLSERCLGAHLKIGRLPRHPDQRSREPVSRFAISENFTRKHPLVSLILEVSPHHDGSFRCICADAVP